MGFTRQKLDEFHVNADIFAIASCSIYRKMCWRGSTSTISRRHYLPVVVDTIKSAMGVWALPPLTSRCRKFSDYVALPASMYQSAHQDPGPDEKVEMNVRRYHRRKDHWPWKHTKEGKVFNPKEDKIFAWLRRIIEWQQELKDNKEFMEIFKIDLFPDEVYVFTPNGDVRELPKGATPVDFAYAIHSELGHRCVGAKVNGKLVPLRYTLKSATPWRS